MAEQATTNESKPGDYIRLAFDNTMEYIQALEDKVDKAKTIIDGQNSEIQKLLRMNYILTEKLHKEDPSVTPLYPIYAKEDPSEQPKQVTDTTPDNPETDPRQA